MALLIKSPIKTVNGFDLSNTYAVIKSLNYDKGNQAMIIELDIFPSDTIRQQFNYQRWNHLQPIQLMPQTFPSTIVIPENDLFALQLHGGNIVAAAYDIVKSGFNEYNQAAQQKGLPTIDFEDVL